MPPTADPEADKPINHDIDRRKPTPETGGLSSIAGIKD
jgi:hypothetical protein